MAETSGSLDRGGMWPDEALLGKPSSRSVAPHRQGDSWRETDRRDRGAGNRRSLGGWAWRRTKSRVAHVDRSVRGSCGVRAASPAETGRQRSIFWRRRSRHLTVCLLYQTGRRVERAGTRASLARVAVYARLVLLGSGNDRHRSTPSRWRRSPRFCIEIGRASATSSSPTRGGVRDRHTAAESAGSKSTVRYFEHKKLRSLLRRLHARWGQSQKAVDQVNLIRQRIADGEEAFSVR